ncbi:MAG: T9SS type A sorting domain-containing protein, partial [Bacteroidales bacterium]
IPPSYGYVTGVLTKFDADMNVQWQHCYGGNNHDAISGILELDNGYVFVGGTASTNMPGHKGDYDVWVVRIDFDGNIIWQKVYGGSRGEGGENIFATDDNGFIVVGNTYSNNGDVSGNHSMSEYYPDIWMFKINSVGELQWQQCFGGGGREEIYKGVVRKSDNNFVIAATTEYGPSYDVGCTPYGGNVVDRDFWVFEILKDDTVNIVTAQVEAEKVRVYPNPAKDYVQFEVQSSKFEVGELRLFDVFGRQVARWEITSEQTNLDVSKLPGGVYFYRIYPVFSGLGVGEVVYSGKILIQR